MRMKMQTLQYKILDEFGARNDPVWIGEIIEYIQTQHGTEEKQIRNAITLLKKASTVKPTRVGHVSFNLEPQQ